MEFFSSMMAANGKEIFNRVAFAILQIFFSHFEIDIVNSNNIYKVSFTKSKKIPRTIKRLYFWSLV